MHAWIFVLASGAAVAQGAPPESDVDCGGRGCAGCSDDPACQQHDDCASGLCAEGRCQAPPPPPGDLTDTRINFTVTDENVLVRPGETSPSVPGLRIDRPSQLGILFFDSYDTRYTGYENLTHIVLYRRYEHRGLRAGRLTAEGALALRLLQVSDVNLSTLDDSSYLRVALSWAGPRAPASLSLTVFPLSADRMRLGYSYRLSWGGSPIFFKYNPDLPASATAPVNSAPAPGARLQLTSEHVTAWAGWKTSTLLNKNPSVAELQAVYGVLGGLGVEGVVAGRDGPRPLGLRFDVNGGYFDRGNNPSFYPTQAVGPGPCVQGGGCRQAYPDFPVWTAGASVQLSLWQGITPSLSADYALFRSDPTSAARYFERPVYREGFNWLVQSELTWLVTALQDFERPQSTTLQHAIAGDVNVRVQVGGSRFKLDASLRSPEFMLVNQPSLVPYASLPAGAAVQPDRFVSLGYDYHLRGAGLTIGPTVGVDFPASIRPPAAIPQLCGNVATSTLCTPSAIVVRGEGDLSILPEGRSARMITAVKLVAREDFLDHFAAILDVYYTHDPNQTHLTQAPDGPAVRDFQRPHSLGFNLTLQARF